MARDNVLARWMLRTPRRLRSAMLVALVLVAIGFTAVWAATTFGPISGPTWLNPGYEWTANVTAMSNPDKVVCIEYTVTPPGTTTLEPCACTTPDCTPATGLGDWICTIGSNYPNATIAWSIGAYSAGGGNSCGALKTPGASGTFDTGPAAVQLVDFAAAPVTSTAGTALAAVALGGVGLAVVYRRRR